MKGIVLAGGSGTRLYPITLTTSKQLLPLYDKPMIYYPLSILFEADIREIVIISTPKHIDLYKELLGTGEDFGVKFYYVIQQEPRGIAEAFLISEDYIKEENVALILGDNVFYGDIIYDIIEKGKKIKEGALISAYYVKDPQRYGIVEFDKEGKPSKIVEKPKNPKSNYAVMGLYFYDKNVIYYAKELKPSQRGELEITDLNNIYLEEGKLNVIKIDKGLAWLDTGTPSSLLEAANFIETIQNRQGLMIAALEEIAYLKGFITLEKLKERAKYFENSEYGKYLLRRIKEFENEI